MLLKQPLGLLTESCCLSGQRRTAGFGDQLRPFPRHLCAGARLQNRAGQLAVAAAQNGIRRCPGFPRELARLRQTVEELGLVDLLQDGLRDASRRCPAWMFFVMTATIYAALSRSFRRRAPHHAARSSGSTCQPQRSRDPYRSPPRSALRT